MEATYHRLVDQIIESFQKHKATSQRKYIIAIAGSPGSGKTTTAKELERRLNALRSSGNSDAPLTVMLPMDGFHLYKRELDAMPNREEAYKRRGAPWTFNPAALYKILLDIREHGSSKVPSFDHNVGDPVEDDISILPQHELVILEGNYVFMDEDIWRDIGTLCDERWLVEIDLDVAMERVVRRHMGTGLSEENARYRVETNDRPNGEEIIRKSRSNATRIVASVQDLTLQIQ